MADNDQRPQQNDNRSPSRRRDWPALIKIIILVFLLLLLIAEIFAGEFAGLKEGGISWLILAFKLLLIALVIWLIRVQKDLRCELTAPSGCTKEESNIATGELFVKIVGTASGAAFGSYTLEVHQDGDPPIPNVVSYPGGGTSGGAAVVNGELGRIQTMTLVDGAYTVTMHVHPAGPGSAKQCTTTFNLLKVMVIMDKVGAIQAVSMAPVADNPNPLDPVAELRKDYAAAPPPHDYRVVSIGGNLTIDGMAYVYGCSGRKVNKYEIRHARVASPGTEPAQPPTLAAIPATWPVGNQIVEIAYTTPDHYLPWTRLGPGPTNLMRRWATFDWAGTTYNYLKERKWHSPSVGSGRYSVLLSVEDSIGARYHDIQHIWLDNEPVYAYIYGIEGVSPCSELALSQFEKNGMNILGYAWDRLIDHNFPDTAPNDNFDHYRLRLIKQGGTHHTIGTYPDRVIVPFRKDGVAAPNPTSGEEGVLANFDIAAVIDAASTGSDPAVSIPRREGCAYILRLDVWDSTRLHDDDHVHHARSDWPFCIVNDLSS